ncbi:MAG: hypothetical protein BWX71_02578 [Deltaproteobacteria bacterium ADurb.Bin072]|nr:MAG: hypothetical protein BWX71_02578 [Deltaproteobacteria bacterium ADurb.Bin072]
MSTMLMFSGSSPRMLFSTRYTMPWTLEGPISMPGLVLMTMEALAGFSSSMKMLSLGMAMWTLAKSTSSSDMMVLASSFWSALW